MNHNKLVNKKTGLAIAISMLLSPSVLASTSVTTSKAADPIANEVAVTADAKLTTGGKTDVAEPKTAVEVIPHDPIQAQMISFEDDELPSNITVSDTSTIKLTNKRFINGKQSLEWDWQSGDSLNIEKEMFYYTPKEAYKSFGRSASTVFSGWIYNEVASDGELEFSFDNGSSFTMKLNFTGWRSPGLAFHRDMKGIPTKNIDNLTITAKGADEGGKIFIDRLMVSLDDIRYQWSDYSVTTAISEPEIDYQLPAELPEVTAEELAAADRVKDNIIDFYMNDFKASKKTIKSVRKQFKKYNLKKVDGVVTGPHLLTSKQAIIYKKKGRDNSLLDADKALFDQYVNFRKYTEHMEKIAQVWKGTNKPAVRKEMADMYILMSEHLMDQGFVKGSSLVTTHHWGYSSRSWYSSMLLMEQPLRDAGLLKPVHESLLWFSREFKERGFDMRVGPKSSDMDYYNTLAIAHMIMLLLEEDDQTRIALLHKYRDFISGNLAQTPVGYADGFRPDGTAFRHKGNYPGYSYAAFRSAANVAYMLADTPFSLNKDARAYLKKVMLAARIYSNPQPGLGTNGRRPFSGVSVNRFSGGMKKLALAAKDDGAIDTELASAYLRIEGKTAEDSIAEFGQLIQPETHPQGAYSFNYAAMGIYRYNDKMVTMKGWNRYVWSSEIYVTANRYGRYQSHGSVQIQKWGKDKEYGYKQDGWDWNRMPGATTIHLPWEKLDSPRQHTMMLTNDSRFSGSTQLQGKYGAFGFTLENPDRWPDIIDPSFTAKKSAFSFENRLVLVGSNISNLTEDYPTETTLFQYGINKKTKPVWINGERITEVPYEAKLAQGDWIIDAMGNGYYVVKGGEVNVRRQDQESRNNLDKTPTFGRFASAWVDHGKAPEDAEYEYIVILDATPESMAKLAIDMKVQETKPYEVIRQDGTAHIVRDKETGVTGYTAFKFLRTSDKYVRSINTSAIVMAKPEGDNLALSVANPDLNMEKTTLSQAVPVSITLIGAWELAESNDVTKVIRKGAKTVVTVMCKDGLPVQLLMKKA